MRRMLTVFGIGLAMAGLAGCGEESQVPGGSSAVLTAVGSSEIVLGGGWEHEIEVRYHDGQGQPLAGAVEFRLAEPGAGAHLRDALAITDAQGIARTTLLVGEEDGALEVVAKAPDAQPISWTINVAASSPPLRLGGEYVVDSELGPLAELPAPAARVRDLFERVSEDEVAWVLDLLVDHVASENLGRELEARRGDLEDAVREALQDSAPLLASRFAEIAEHLDEAARHVGTTTVLQIGALGSGAVERTGSVGTHTLTGMTFQVAGGTYHFALGLGAESVRTSRVQVSAVGAEEVEIGAHALPLRYGKMLVAALEQVILRRVASPHVIDLETFVRRHLDCKTLAQAVSDSMTGGSAVELRDACELGAEVLVDRVIDELLSLDGDAGVYLEVSGRGAAFDKCGDQIVDFIDGSWSGAMVRGGAILPLDETATQFHAGRVSVR
jgi:hypothetical protein